MSDTALIPVAKDGDYLEVHPTTLQAHRLKGWRECERRVAQTDDTKATRVRKRAAVAEGATA